MKFCFEKKLWKEIAKTRPEKYFEFALKQMPSQELLKALELHRGKGRNDYPVRILWSQLLSKLILGKQSLSVPNYALSRFLSKLLLHQDQLSNMIEKQVQALHKKIPLFGSVLVVQNLEYMQFCGVTDALTALPILRGGVQTNSFHSIYRLLEKIQTLLPNSLYRERCLIADQTYDDSGFCATLWDRYRIKPIIALSQDASFSIRLKQNAFFNANGELICGFNQPMAYAGFEAKRNSLQFRCFSKHYGISCEFAEKCRTKKKIRIPLELDRRLITPIPRSIYKWRQLYELASYSHYFHDFLKDFDRKNNWYSDEKKPVLHLLATAILYSLALSYDKTTTCGQNQSQKAMD